MSFSPRVTAWCISGPWSNSIGGTNLNTFASTKVVLGALKSIKETIDNGYLLKIEDLVFAEAFSNLLEQAEYLFKSGYLLASGVLGRAVLEEKLRNLCKSKGIVFSKSNPTLTDFNTELYKLKYYDKIEFKSIDYLISVGNNAAHNLPIQESDVKKLLEGVVEVLKKHK